jgi:peptidoglycan/LPS O-acetylase OafA/YrhL
MWVVLLHYTGIVHQYPFGLQVVVDNGFTGVNVIFILSGFVVVYNYYDWFSASTSRYLEFLQARFVRIYPVYLLALIIGTVPAVRCRLLASFSVGKAALSWLFNRRLVVSTAPA